MSAIILSHVIWWIRWSIIETPSMRRFVRHTSFGFDRLLFKTHCLRFGLTFLLPAWLHGKYRYLRIPHPRQRVLARCAIILTGSVRIRVQIHQYSRKQHQTFIKIIRCHTHGDASHQHDNLLWRYPLTKGWNGKLWSHRRLFPTVYKIIHCCIISYVWGGFFIIIFLFCFFFLFARATS